MKVLYLSHTASVSGGERSLLDLLGALPADVSPLVASPEGNLARMVDAAGVPHLLVAGTAGSLRLHWRKTPRAWRELLTSAAQLRRLTHRYRPDLVHANSLRAGIIAGLAQRNSSAPLVTHVRDALPPGRVSRATVRFVGRRSNALIANSRFTCEWNRLSEVCERVDVLYGPVDLTRFDPSRVDRGAARAHLGVGNAELVLSVVGQITPWKGQLEAVEMVGLLAKHGVPARLLLTGSTMFVDEATRYDNRAYLARVDQRIGELELRGHVELLGQREDVPEIIGATDIVLVPSWEEPMGRTVLEAMAMSRPVIASSVGGPSELLTDGVHGRLLPPRSPEIWSDALRDLAAKPRLLARMGQEGRAHTIRRFGLAASILRLMALYQGLQRVS